MEGLYIYIKAIEFILKEINKCIGSGACQYSTTSNQYLINVWYEVIEVELELIFWKCHKFKVNL